MLNGDGAIPQAGEPYKIKGEIRESKLTNADILFLCFLAAMM
jgi:hypothetical protein